MKAVLRKNYAKRNISSRLLFVIERNCVLYVVANKTEEKVVDRNTKSRKVQDIQLLAVHQISATIYRKSAAKMRRDLTVCVLCTTQKDAFLIHATAVFFLKNTKKI